ncbi:ganglioside GM2 activator-like [Haliotis rufescens]|uniref:ganglioside GM2 activator-like n=1 Tax=Haliotis rufescens TaxID=6454 RepID=UPI00201F7D91|nr:ganglioside GM2 activator-like [Haliotis rufescens]
MNIFTTIALFCAISGACSYHVTKFKSYDETTKDAYDIMEILMRHRTPERYLPQSYFQKYGGGRSSQLTSFSYKNCGDPATETARLLDLQITPDPIVLPGNVQLAFKVQNLKTAQSPIQADVVLRKKILSIWVEIPCIENVGSCSYSDFCEVLAPAQCPEPFTENNIPCKCPFPEGNYTLPSTQLEINLSDIPSGDYSGQIDLKMDSAPIACYEVEITLA